MTITTGPAITISFIAGEDLRAGDFVMLDIATGRLVRAQGQYLCVIPRSYRAGEDVANPWRGEW